MLKNYSILITLLFFSITSKSQCNDQLVSLVSTHLKSFVYVKDFKVRLKEVKRKKDPKNVSYSIILNKDMNYRFAIADAKEFEGRLVFELFNDKGKLISSYNPSTKKHYSAIDFKCRKSGIHYIILGFTGTKEGCGILMYSFKKSAMDNYLQR